MIRNVVFDMGGVLRDFDPEYILSSFGISDPDDILAVRRESFDTSYWVDVDRGTLLDDDAVALMCPRMPERLRAAAEDAIRNWWTLPVRKVEGMDELIAEIHSLGYRLYILSNASAHLHQYCDQLPGAQYFDGIFVSADWKLVKPEREIYEKFWEHFGLDPAECLFIDDNNVNVSESRHFGMDAITFFHDVPRLRRQLREKGIMVSEQG